LKNQGLNEVQLSGKQQTSLVSLAASKFKEFTLRSNYDQERFQLLLENKFKSLISQREAEWERAWDKRDQLLAAKDAQIRD
jgi:hypothetical protein